MRDVKIRIFRYNAIIMGFKKAFLAILTVVVIHIVFMATGVYGAVPEIDNLLHFSGGFVIGLLAIAIHHDMTDKHDLFGHPSWYHYLFVIGFVMLIGVAWEFHEYMLDNTAVIWWGWPQNQFGLRDTMLDLFMDGCGGSLAFLIFKKAL